MPAATIASVFAILMLLPLFLIHLGFANATALRVILALTCWPWMDYMKKLG